jgi:hypothetical protein
MKGVHFSFTGAGTIEKSKIKEIYIGDIIIKID